MAMRRNTSARSRCGFTLIELLTVLAIVGVLAGILIPVVGHVRASTQDAVCRSNLRQFGLAVQTYGAERGYYPPSVSGGTAANRGGFASGEIWSFYLRSYLGVNSAVNGAATNSQLMVCPAAAVKVEGQAISSYSANPAIMPDLSASATGAAVRFGTVPRPSQVILLGDAIQRNPDGAHSNFWNVPDMTGADEYSWGDPANANTPIVIGSDTDGVSDAQFRYRHDGRANVVFVDGHAGSFKKGTILRKNVRINY